MLIQMVIPFSAISKTLDNKLSGSIDSLQSLKLAKIEVAKAKESKNWKQLTLNYKLLLYKSEKQFWHRYADSMFIAAKQSNDNLLIGSAYLTKGTIYYNQKQHKKALDNYILADNYIAKTTDEYAIHKVKYCIAQTKYYLGFYHEAIALFRECIKYYEEESDQAYLNSLHSLGLCYNRIGKYNLCTDINKTGLKAANELSIHTIKPYFIHSEGVNQYGEHNYNEAIKSLKTVLPHLERNKDFANESVAHFYIGKSYWDLGKKELAINYFKKVDKAFGKYNYIRPDLRNAYELMINYYEEKNDAKWQLHYINKLLKVDQVISKNYIYLSRKIDKEYDTKKLLNEKKQIETNMDITILMAISIFVFLIGTIITMVLKNRNSKKRFKELMQKETSIAKPTLKKTTEADIEINQEVVEEILKNLEIFEKEKLFIEKDMTMVKVAILIKTNTKYASKVIVKYRGKKFIDYIRDLKVDYIVELLKQENKYRNYTNEALAEEGGFGTTQNFTRAFKSRTGISPSFFCQELKKSITTCD